MTCISIQENCNRTLMPQAFKPILCTKAPVFALCTIIQSRFVLSAADTTICCSSDVITAGLNGTPVMLRTGYSKVYCSSPSAKNLRYLSLF